MLLPQTKIRHATYITLDDRLVASRFKSITRGFSTPLEKGLACYTWVAKNIAYVKEEKGEDEWQFPSQTLRKRQGDCEDHALLLQTFLLMSGLDAFFCRGYILGDKEFHAFCIVVNHPKLGLNYWDSTVQENKAVPLAIVFEAINTNGVFNKLGMTNFIPMVLPLV